MAYANRGDNNSAIQQYNNGISINPNIPNLYHNLANAYVAQGNYGAAEQNYLQAIAVDPNFIYSWQALANLYRQTGQKAKLTQLVEKYNQIFAKPSPPK